MATNNYGWSGLYNRNNPKPNTSFSTFLDDKFSSLLIIAKVVDILLIDSDIDKFSSLGEWNGIGTVIYETFDNKELGVARPIDYNIKKFPLLNEIIAIIPSFTFNSDENPYSVAGFYFSPISIWSHPHINALPPVSEEFASSQYKSYAQTTLGSYVVSPNESSNPTFGKTFIERSNIHPLLPFEGDVIMKEDGEIQYV